MVKALTRKLHPSWLVALASAGLLIGIALTARLDTSYFARPQWLVIALAIFLITLVKRVVAFALLAIIAGLLLGFWRGGQLQIANNNYQQFIGKNVILKATVADDVSNKNGQVGLPLDHIVINNIELPSKIWGGTSTSKKLKRGDTVILNGKLQTGFGEYAASMSHAKSISTSPTSSKDLARKIRDNFTNGLKKSVPSPEAELGAGYLDGQHNEVPDELVQNLKLVGLIHIVIAGGYNATILVRYVRRRLAKTSRYLATAGASLVLLGMLAITGFSAPMSRTVVITLLSLITWYYGRRIHPLVLLPFSAAITALVDPTFVKSAVGWYLTFIAYGGLIIMGPMIERYFWHDTKPNGARRIFLDTLSVSIVTMPLLAFSFQQYSIYSLPANLLVLPLMPITMLAAVVAGVFGMFLPLAAAQIIGWPARILLTYTDKITNWLAGAPGAHFSASFSVGLLVASYGAIAAIIYFLWRKTHYNFRESNLVE